MTMTNGHSALASRQALLRARYDRNPPEATTVKRVRTVADRTTDPLHGTVRSPEFPGQEWDFGIDQKVGGEDDLPNPGHLLCGALAACLDSTIRMLADVLGVGLLRLQVDVVGFVDVRGCLAIDDSVRAGFERITCEIDLETDPSADPRRKKALMERAERLCVTLDTLRHGVPIAISFERPSTESFDD